MTEQDAERQFEELASTMDRQQLYDLAKRKWLDEAHWRRHVAVSVQKIVKLREDNATLRRELRKRSRLN